MTPQQTIAHYKIVAKIGEGGMGAVYRATDARLNRDVAIEVLRDSLAQGSGRMSDYALRKPATMCQARVRGC